MTIKRSAAYADNGIIIHPRREPRRLWWVNVWLWVIGKVWGKG